MSKAVGTLITPKGKVKEIVFQGEKITFNEIRKLVKGYVEFVWLKDGKILIVNEEGKFYGLPYNDIATQVIVENGMNDYIVGNAIILESKYVD
jgi:hypothetical protein